MFLVCCSRVSNTIVETALPTNGSEHSIRVAVKNILLGLPKTVFSFAHRGYRPNPLPPVAQDSGRMVWHPRRSFPRPHVRPSPADFLVHRRGCPPQSRKPGDLIQYCVFVLYTVPTGKSLLLAQPRPSNRPIPPPGQPVVKPDIGPAVVVRPVTRPPLAGPYAFSRIPAPLWNNKPRVFLRHALQDTWLFANLSTWYGLFGEHAVVLPFTMFFSFLRSFGSRFFRPFVKLTNHPSSPRFRCRLPR